MRALFVVFLLTVPTLALAQTPASAPQTARPDREVLTAKGRLVATISDDASPDSGGLTRLSLPPGEYLVRFRGEAGQRVALGPGATLTLDNYGLTLAASGGRYAPRAAPVYEAPPPPYEEEPEPYVQAPPPRRPVSDRFVLHFALGWSDAHSSIGFPGLDFGNNAFGLTVGFDFGITERLRWIAPLPLFAYRIGERAKGKVELEPWGGVTNIGFGWNDFDGNTFNYALGVGVDGRLWGSQRQAWAFGFRAQTAGMLSSYQPQQKPDTIRTVLTSAYQLKSRWVNLSIGLGLAENVLYQNVAPSWSRVDDRFDLRLGIGSMQNFGPFPEPLIAFNLSPRFSLDMYGAIEWSLHDGSAADSFLFGFTWKI
jgi:hypothetical protein